MRLGQGGREVGGRLVVVEFMYKVYLIEQRWCPSDRAIPSWCSMEKKMELMEGCFGARDA